MTFCTITPTRSDRPQFLEFCKHQLSRMTVKPDHSYFVDYPPDGKEIDLIPRVRAGVAQAIADGFEEIFIVEDDDFYEAGYFELMKLGNADFIGCETTLYYNIKERRYQKIPHAGRSSLFTTGFKTHVMTDFRWPPKQAIQLDIALWKHSTCSRPFSRFKKKFAPACAVGIKHGTGLCAGGGHIRQLKEVDPDMEWLRAHVDQEAFVFYKTLKL